MIELYNKNDIEMLAVSNGLVAEVLHLLADYAKPGVSTMELDQLAEQEILQRDARPAFKGYRGFPATICASLNEELVHGIPRKDKILKEGDILSIDLGCLKNGFYGDSALTVAIGEIPAAAKRLLQVTKQSLSAGIEQAVVGNRLFDISSAIQKVVETAGFSIVRDFVGHGIGRNLHQDPQVPNFGKPGTGLELQAGMVLALEPMVNFGGPEIEVLKDGWTAVSKDRQLTAHFEHTIVVSEKGSPIILSKFE